MASQKRASGDNDARVAAEVRNLRDTARTMLLQADPTQVTPLDFGALAALQQQQLHALLAQQQQAAAGAGAGVGLAGGRPAGATAAAAAAAGLLPGVAGVPIGMPVGAGPGATLPASLQATLAGMQGMPLPFSAPLDVTIPVAVGAAPLLTEGQADAGRQAAPAEGAASGSSSGGGGTSGDDCGSGSGGDDDGDGGGAAQAAAAAAVAAAAAAVAKDVQGADSRGALGPAPMQVDGAGGCGHSSGASGPLAPNMLALASGLPQPGVYGGLAAAAMEQNAA
jgi:hypothetical protein